MNHDADYLDKEELVRLDYANCLMYIQVFFEDHNGNTHYFSTDGALEKGFLFEEAQDKIHSMVRRGYLKCLSEHYELYCITNQGLALVNNSEYSGEL